MPRSATPPSQAPRSSARRWTRALRAVGWAALVVSAALSSSPFISYSAFTENVGTGAWITFLFLIPFVVVPWSLDWMYTLHVRGALWVMDTMWGVRVADPRRWTRVAAIAVLGKGSNTVLLRASGRGTPSGWFTWQTYEDDKRDQLRSWLAAVVGRDDVTVTARARHHLRLPDPPTVGRRVRLALVSLAGYALMIAVLMAALFAYISAMVEFDCC